MFRYIAHGIAWIIAGVALYMLMPTDKEKIEKIYGKTSSNNPIPSGHRFSDSLKQAIEMKNQKPKSS